LRADFNLVDECLHFCFFPPKDFTADRQTMTMATADLLMRLSGAV
jgi:hypothetical protein